MYDPLTSGVYLIIWVPDMHELLAFYNAIFDLVEHKYGDSNRMLSSSKVPELETICIMPSIAMVSPRLGNPSMYSYEMSPWLFDALHQPDQYIANHCSQNVNEKAASVEMLSTDSSICWISYWRSATWMCENRPSDNVVIYQIKLFTGVWNLNAKSLFVFMAKKGRWMCSNGGTLDLIYKRSA